MIHASLDVQQTRLTRSVMVVEGDASRWDRVLSQNCMITDDGMAFVRPYQKTPAWETTTGSTSLFYKRFGLADLAIEAGTTLAIAGGYIANDLRLAGDTFVENLGGTNARVYTSGSWLANQGFFLECWVPASKGAESTAIDFAWGEVDTVGTVGVRLYVGGEVEVYKWFDVGGTPTQTMVARYDGRGQGRSARALSSSGQRISIMLLPCSRRDLYISTSLGTTVRHTFEDLSPDSVGTITPAGRAWFYVPVGKLSVSLSNLRFYTDPVNLWTEVDYLREAPTGTAAWTISSYWDVPGASSGTSVTGTVVHPTNYNTAYPSTGGPDSARILLQLTAGNTRTPFVYAAYARLAPATDTLPGGYMHLISGNSTSGVIDTANDTLLGFDLSVGEQADAVSGTLQLKDRTDEPLYLQSGHSIRILASRPETVTSFGNWRNLALGVTKAPKITEAQRGVAGGFRHISMPFADLWHLLDAAIFEENSYPYDGWLLHLAVKDLLVLAGVPTSPLDIPTSTVRLDYVRPTTDTDWAWKPQAGDSVGQWLKKIHETMAPTWQMGFYPTDQTYTGGSSAQDARQTWGFRFKSTSAMSTTPAATIYLAAEGATLAAYEPAGGNRIPCYSFAEERDPAAATRITIWGYDPASKTLLRGNWSDPTLEDPTPIPTSRPAGWVGYASPYVAIYQRLRTPASVAAARDAAAEELGTEKRLAEWECPLLYKSDGVIVWKGECVEIRPATTPLPGGAPEGGRYRVKSFSVSWKRDAKGRRLVAYMGERIGDIT